MKNYRQASLADLLLIFRRNIIERFRKEGMEHDLTFSQLETLRFIGSEGAQTMRSIADYLKITPPSATVIVAEMEKKGLVRRKSDKKDRRVVFIALTDAAKKLCVSASRHKEAIMKKMTSKLSRKDRGNIERIIRILVTEK